MALASMDAVASTARGGRGCMVQHITRKSTCWTCSQLQSLKINQNVAQNAENRLQITKHLLAAGAPPQTLMNTGAYNVFPDSLFWLPPHQRKFPTPMLSTCWGGGLPDILSVHLLAACTSSPKVFQPLTPLYRRHDERSFRGLLWGALDFKVIYQSYCLCDSSLLQRQTAKFQKVLSVLSISYVSDLCNLHNLCMTFRLWSL